MPTMCHHGFGWKCVPTTENTFFILTCCWILCFWKHVFSAIESNFVCFSKKSQWIWKITMWSKFGWWFLPSFGSITQRLPAGSRGSAVCVHESVHKISMLSKGMCANAASHDSQISLARAQIILCFHFWSHENTADESYMAFSQYAQTQ